MLDLLLNNIKINIVRQDRMVGRGFDYTISFRIFFGKKQI